MGITVGGLGLCFLDFFYPNTGGGGSGALPALDRNGDVVTLTGWGKDHKEGDRALV